MKSIECKPFFVIATYKRLVARIDERDVRRRMIELAFGGHSTNYSSFILGRKRIGALILKRICAVLGIGAGEFLEYAKMVESGKILEVPAVERLSGREEFVRFMETAEQREDEQCLPPPASRPKEDGHRLTVWQEFTLFATNSLRASIKGQISFELSGLKARISVLEAKIDSIAEAVGRLEARI